MGTMVAIQECAAPDELFRWYGEQQEPQPTHIALDVRTGRMWADYDANIGFGMPGEVYYGLQRWWRCPLLTGDGANEVMAEIEPLAQRVLDGASVTIDGNANRVAVLDDDATAAEEKIEALLAEQNDDTNPRLLPLWTVYTVGELWTADEAGITAETTDAELEQITARLLAEFREGQEQPHAIIDGLDGYVRGLRDELRDAAADED